MKVTGTVPGSRAERSGVRPGDALVALGDLAVEDGLDVTYAVGCAGGEEIAWRFARGPGRFTALLPAARPEELGILLSPDAHRTCPNHCIFCFVDQLPGGLRPSLYVKDEDFRLSFAYGNYITLANLRPRDYERIVGQRLSPIYVSVHTTDDAIRRTMLGNPAAPPILDALRRLASAGVELHLQIVVCPSVNDGPALERTIGDLCSVGPSVRSVAVVPVGLTRHRRRLRRIDPVGRELASEIVGCVERWQRRELAERGTRVVYAADELYIVAGRELPPIVAYEDLPQLENGVGLLRSFEADFARAARALLGRRVGPLAVAIVTAPLAAPFLARVVCPPLAAAGVETTVIVCENTLLGPSVTVAGLLPGGDMVPAARSAPPGALVLLPADALNTDGLTIDGLSTDDIARAAGRRHLAATRDIVGSVVRFVENASAGARGEAA